MERPVGAAACFCSLAQLVLVAVFCWPCSSLLASPAGSHWMLCFLFSFSVYAWPLNCSVVTVYILCRSSPTSDIVTWTHAEGWTLVFPSQDDWTVFKGESPLRHNPNLLTMAASLLGAARCRPAVPRALQTPHMFCLLLAICASLCGPYWNAGILESLLPEVQPMFNSCHNPHASLSSSLSSSNVPGTPFGVSHHCGLLELGADLSILQLASCKDWRQSSSVVLVWCPWRFVNMTQ